jgi:uncharacterized protein YdeI (BOF family)
MAFKLYRNLALAATLSVIVNPALVKAQTSISDLQKRSAITIAGKVQSVVGNDFILDDGTGEVIVDAGPRWWRKIDLSPGESVTVIGEMDREEFEAFSITRANGQTIEIRPSEGPPPWEREGREK